MYAFAHPSSSFDLRSPSTDPELPVWSGRLERLQRKLEELAVTRRRERLQRELHELSAYLESDLPTAHTTGSHTTRAEPRPAQPLSAGTERGRFRIA